MRVLGLAIFCMLGLCWSVPAQAVEAVTFQKPSSFTIIPAAIAQGKDKQSAEFIQTDLNKDGAKEWIVRETGSKCTANTGCPYFVYAQKNREWIEIGSFSAFKILIADKTEYGVRNILVYNLPLNDFATVTYGWSPEKYRYELRS